MAAKSYGTAVKSKQLTRYLGEVWVYTLSRVYKKGKFNTKHVVISSPKPISGKKVVNIWSSDENGKMDTTTPINMMVGGTIEEALEQIGYKLG